MKPFVRIAAYVWLIIVGAIAIVIPGGDRICLTCAPVLNWLAGLVAIALGVIGLVTDARPQVSQPGAPSN